MLRAYPPSHVRHEDGVVPQVAITLPLDSLYFDTLVQRISDLPVEWVRCSRKPIPSGEGWTDTRRVFDTPIPSVYVHVSIYWIQADSAMVVISRWQESGNEFDRCSARYKSGSWDLKCGALSTRLR